MQVALDEKEKKLLICMPISKEFPFIFFNQSKNWKCLPTFLERERQTDLWLFLGNGGLLFLTVSFHQFVPVPISKKRAWMTTQSTGWQNHSHWKAAQEVSSPTSCGKEGQQWDQTRLLAALSSQVLKTRMVTGPPLWETCSIAWLSLWGKSFSLKAVWNPLFLHFTSAVSCSPARHLWILWGTSCY